MFKKALLLVVVVNLLMSGAIADETMKQRVHMPEGFQGIYLEMPIPRLLRIRPQANVGPMSRRSPGEELDTTKLNQSLQEFIEKDPVFGLNLFAVYRFGDGKLRSLLLIWRGDINQIRKHRSDFVSSCTERWGKDYQKRTLKLEPETKREHLVPVFVWQKADTMITALCTSEYEDKPLEQGVFMVNVFTTAVKEIFDVFAGERVEESVRDKLFLEIGVVPQDTGATDKE